MNSWLVLVVFALRSYMAVLEKSAMAKEDRSAQQEAVRTMSAALTVSDIPAPVSFYQKLWVFSKRNLMYGPDVKPIHAELTLRGTTLVLGLENGAVGRRGAKSVGARGSWEHMRRSLQLRR